MCSAPNVYMFVYILIGTHMVPLSLLLIYSSKKTQIATKINQLLLLPPRTPHKISP